MTLQSFLSIDALLTAIVALIFGLIVISRNKKSIVNRTGFLLTLATAFWSFGYWRWLSIYNDGETALFWTRILSIGSTLIPLFYFHWIISLLGLNQQKRRLIWLSYFLTAFFLLFSFSDLLVRSVEPVSYFAFWPKAGPLYTIYLISVYACLVVYSIILLLKERSISYGARGEQIKYVLLGTILGFGGGATNFPLWYGINILPIGTILVILYPILFSYAIVRHRLMDIKLALRQSIVYILSVLAVAVPASGVLYLVNQFISQYVTYASIAVLVVAVSVFSPIRDYYYRIANKYFFSSLYDGREVIAKISDGLRSTLEAGQIYNLISDVLTNSFHIKSVGILNYNKAQGCYVVAANNGFDLAGRQTWPGKALNGDGSDKKSGVIIVEEMKTLPKRQQQDVAMLLADIGAAAIAPLNIKDEPLGAIVLGQKESGDMYNDEDLKTLETISSQAAIAIKNAQLYGETKQFSVTLQQEVERQTKELKHANEELKKLDKAKSDFVSIASHQLRTPLTAIKGFTSMILEGTYGRVTKTVQDKLEKIFESSERLTQLVNNLLDLSHMEGGKMEFNFAKVDFDGMVKSVVEELAPVAAKNKLKFTWQTTDENFWVWADEQKLRQVVMNLIDNAIKYTRKGEVNVSLTRQGNEAVMAVRDTGVGLPPGESERLFHKFVRGPEASRYHTEGTGVGLYVAKKLIEEHKGNVWAESPGEGLGSTFFIRLPEWKGKG